MMRSPSKRPLVILMALSLTACGESGATGWAGQIDTLSNGVVQVRNPAAPLWDSASAWTLEEELRIGSADAEGPDGFGYVAGLAVDADGRIWVVDRQARELRIFGPDGSHVRTVGRQGEGPGEFQDPIGVEIAPDGRVWVVDAGNARYSIHDPTGNFIESRRRMIGGYSVPWRGGFKDDGWFWETGVFRAEEGVRSAILRMDRSLAPVDTLLLPQVGDKEVFELTTDGGYITANVPFTPDLVWERAPDGALWLASTGDYRLHRTVDRDTTSIVEREFGPVPVTDQEKEEAVENLEWFMAQGGQVDPSRIPDTKPILNRFAVDPTGHLWVLVNEVGESEDYPFDVFDPEGRYLGRVWSPIPFDPRTIFRSDEIYGVGSDELGAPQVVKLRLRGPEDQNRRVGVRPGSEVETFVPVGEAVRLSGWPSSRRQPPPADPVRYAVRPQPTDSLIRLHVSTRFRGEADGTTRFALPSDRFGAGEMHEWITDVRPDPATRLSAAEPGVYTARHAPGAGVEIAYVLTYNPEAAGFVAFGPSVGPDHFHFFGSQWMAKVGPSDGPRHVEVTFETDGWSGAVGSSYGIGPGPHRVAASDYDLDYSVIAGGSYRTARSSCRGRPVLAMVRGALAVEDADVFALVDRIVCGQREAFDDFDRPFFTVFVTERDGIRAGAPLLHGFTAFLEPSISPAELRGLLAHEMIHTWLPRTARLVDPGRPEASEAWTSWFHEGFTEYLARIVLVRQGMAPLSWMVERVNEDVTRLAYHPYRTLTLEGLEEAAQEGRYNNHHHRLHYLRGALLALNWDTRIRTLSGGERSLLDAIRSVVREADGPDGTIAFPAFVEVLDRFGVDARSDVQRYLRGGEPLEPEAAAFTPTYELSSYEAPGFDLGIDRAALIEERRVAGLRPGGAAERAGLREGMRVVDIENASPWTGGWDPERPSVVVVEEDEDRRRFEIRAANRAIAIPRFVPTTAEPIEPDG